MNPLKSRILEIFWSVREDRDAPYEEKDFLEFLIKPNGKRIDDSFKGTRYKHRFVEKVEMEFRVCFPDSFFEKRWNLEDLAAYVDARRQKPDVNRRMALKRLWESQIGNNVIPFVFFNAILFRPLSLLLRLGPYGWLCLIVPIALNVLLLHLMLANISYQKRLLARIEARGNAKKDDARLADRSLNPGE